LAGLALLASCALILLHRKKLRMKQESATLAVEKGFDRETPPTTPPEPAYELFSDVMKSPMVVQENHGEHDVHVHDVYEMAVTPMAAELEGGSMEAASRKGSEDTLKM
jgi:hypothetical protein